jgi:hypothetical protein
MGEKRERTDLQNVATRDMDTSVMKITLTDGECQVYVQGQYF